jgi:hypothetical protein
MACRPIALALLHTYKVGSRRVLCEWYNLKRNALPSNCAGIATLSKQQDQTSQNYTFEFTFFGRGSHGHVRRKQTVLANPKQEAHNN